MSMILEWLYRAAVAQCFLDRLSTVDSYRSSDNMEPGPSMPSLDYNKAPDLNMPVFLHGTDKQSAAELALTGVYAKNAVAKLGQGLYTTTYWPTEHWPKFSEKEKAGQKPVKEELVRILNGYTAAASGYRPWRHFMWRSQVDGYDWKRYRGVVGLQLESDHYKSLSVAVVPRSRFNKVNETTAPECLQFDALTVPVLPTTRLPPKCRYLEDYVEDKTKSTCTPLGRPQFEEAVKQNCLQEVKWNRVGDEPKLPPFLRPVFLGSNNPDKKYYDVIPFFDSSSEEEWKKRMCRVQVQASGSVIPSRLRRFFTGCKKG